MLILKALHIVFVVSWFAGLFYLPRLFVNHAMVTDAATRDRLALMERKLYRFMTPPLAVLAVVLGIWLWLGYGFAGGAGCMSRWHWSSVCLPIMSIAAG